MTTTDPTPPTRAVLLAHPAGHSLSPVMHDAAFAAAGMSGRYEAWDVPPAALGPALARLRERHALLGANVTVPHKEAVIALLDELTPEAEGLGAVNTIVRRGRRLVGHNTDAIGLAAALAGLARPPGRGTAVVLGAGGAARAAVATLMRAGSTVQIHNRTRARAEALAVHMRGFGQAEVVSDEELADAIVAADWLVNTTSVGMRGGPPGCPSPNGVVPAAGVVIDLVYRPRPTPLLAAARAAGLETQDGVAMLVHQGAASFTAWTGREAALEAMFGAVERALTDATA